MEVIIASSRDRSSVPRGSLCAGISEGDVGPAQTQSVRNGMALVVTEQGSILRIFREY